MKACPYCAEQIQDEAIVCRYCGREFDPQAAARVSGALIQGSTPAIRESEQTTFSVSGVAMLYDSLLNTLRISDPEHIKNYPLSLDRRPRTIAELIVQGSEDSTTLRGGGSNEGENEAFQ